MPFVLNDHVQNTPMGSQSGTPSGVLEIADSGELKE
jgi:hypothetical protein